MTVNVYATKVLLALWNESPTAMIIDNAQAADSFKAYFNLLWKNAKQ
ncbi:hypothetical protein HY993_04945 [Candidatus Micrarchaeota archaeon]|nr:hypothetical protein [Candidatus Micrarchaeota archaeon]